DHPLKCVDEVYGVVCAVGALVDADVDVRFTDGVAVLGGFTGDCLYPVLDFLALPHFGGAVVADRQLGRDQHRELLPHAFFPSMMSSRYRGRIVSPRLSASRRTRRRLWRMIAGRSSVTCFLLSRSIRRIRERWLRSGQRCGGMRSRRGR